jgi:hypothetical protein
LYVERFYLDFTGSECENVDTSMNRSQREPGSSAGCHVELLDQGMFTEPKPMKGSDYACISRLTVEARGMAQN